MSKKKKLTLKEIIKRLKKQFKPRVVLPPNKVYRDKKKYTRKQKHKSKIEE